ncbi:oligosaccharide flippase family protein [Nakamurella leprariae]|uniref:Oligosaccharide flippase family protein n=1 Tax=Nakamurella leprariae TaxID=2803911 RepID=A0A938YHF6_9ACTN|nr:oligosaccharide flippase family protein [Nakamurella leprariae]MBM9467870.1 oligosaccharide flippase family protein [Nakamurella leprariae]
MEKAERPAGSSLFGRDLLYVVVWSLQLVTSTLISPVLAHLLGPAQFGEVATVISLYQVFVVLAVVGFDRAIPVQRAEDSDDGRARGLLAIGLVIAGVLSALVGLTSPLWASAVGLGSDPWLAWAMVLWAGPASVVQLMCALLLAQDRLKAFSLLSSFTAVGGQVLGILFVLLLGSDSGGAGRYLTGLVISAFAALAVGIWLTRPRLGSLTDLPLARRTLRLGIPVMFGSLSLFVVNAADRVMVGRLLDLDEVGRYQVAYTVGSIAVLLLSSVGQTWTARIAEERDPQARRLLMGWSRDILYRLMVPVTLGLVLGAPLVLRIVAPASFDPGGLVPTTVLVAVCGFVTTAIGATNRSLLIGRRAGPLAVSAWASLVVHVVVALVAIPLIGILGTAVAVLVGWLVQAALQRWANRGLGALPATPRPVLLSVGAVLVVALVCALLPQPPLLNGIRFGVAVACVPWFLLVLRRAQRAEPPGRPADPRGGSGD